MPFAPGRVSWEYVRSSGPATIHHEAMPVHSDPVSIVIDVVEDVDLELVAWSCFDDRAGKLA